MITSRRRESGRQQQGDADAAEDGLEGGGPGGGGDRDSGASEGGRGQGQGRHVQGHGQQPGDQSMSIFESFLYFL